jgi:hypothetical protein
MTFMGWIGKYTCMDHKRNDDIKTDLKILDKISKYPMDMTC